jgi:ferrous iron transport protein A
LRLILSLTKVLAMPSESPVNLCSARCGEKLRILALRSGVEECNRLREMGLCESSEICKVMDGSAIICSVYGMRLAIGRALGEAVLVEPVLA